MIACHLLRQRNGTARYYHVDVVDNLFGEYTVLREWGVSHGGRCLSEVQRINWFSNLRDACLAAERWRKRAERRGYVSRNAAWRGVALTCA